MLQAGGRHAAVLQAAGREAAVRQPRRRHAAVREPRRRHAAVVETTCWLKYINNKAIIIIFGVFKKY